MYAAIRRGMLPSHSINAFIKQAADTFAFTLTALPGFVDYYITRVGTLVLRFVVQSRGIPFHLSHFITNRATGHTSQQ